MTSDVFTLSFWGGPRCGELVPWGCINACGIWFDGGVYRYSPEREAYVWCAAICP